MSDEIGHFENCLQVDADFNCVVPGAQDAGGLDEDDDNDFCVPASDSTLVKINGCFSGGRGLGRAVLPQGLAGDEPEPFLDRLLHPTPGDVHEPAARTARRTTPKVAFETDLPRIEAADSQDNPPFCDRTTGANCVNPPTGAQFYPIFTTAQRYGSCLWQEGGPYLPHTTNTFGGTSTAEYGPLLKTVYPVTGFTTVSLYNNFNSGDMRNPCRVKNDR